MNKRICSAIYHKISEIYISSISVLVPKPNNLCKHLQICYFKVYFTDFILGCKTLLTIKGNINVLRYFFSVRTLQSASNVAILESIRF